MVVQMMRRHLHGKAHRTDFQLQGRAARRHEPERNIGAQQHGRQHQAGGQHPLLRVRKPQSHNGCANDARVRWSAPLRGAPFDCAAPSAVLGLLGD